MPCQVPVASFPFDIGTLTLAPIRDDLMCACTITQSAICPHVTSLGASIPAYHRSPLRRACKSLFRLRVQSVSQDLGTANCYHPTHSSFLAFHTPHAPLSSFTIPSNASLISALTSSSQFSFIDSAQLVCCRKRCSSPHFMPAIWGSEEVTWSVTRCEPRPREGRVKWCWV